MEARTAQAWIDPYLDGQLTPSGTSRFEQLLLNDVTLRTLLKTQKAFRSFLQRALASVEIPKGLDERIRARLAGLSADGRTQAVGSWGRRWWRLSAAILVACCCLVTYQVLCAPTGLCRYVTAFTHEHQRVMEGKLPLAVATGDPEQVLAYVERTVAPGWARLPEMAGCRAVGAGPAAFPELAPLGAPEGLFVRYDDGVGRPLVLFVHEWPSEHPTVEVVEFSGTKYWVTKQDGVSFVGWRAPDGLKFYSLTGPQDVPDLLRKAVEACSSVSHRAETATAAKVR